jgi:hypothetical protein
MLEEFLEINLLEKVVCPIALAVHAKISKSKSYKMIY